MLSIEALMDRLVSRDNTAACGAARELEAISLMSAEVYPQFSRLAGLLDSDNSYVRNRALTLLAVNARWDTENRFDETIDAYLLHITDVKPITARQCIKGLPDIAKAKPRLKNRIIDALKRADTSAYADSMRPLVDADIYEALSAINKCGL